MIHEMKKAVEALHHPGIDTNLLKLVRNAVPYYLSPSIAAASPLTIYWSINSVCNLKCKMCDVGLDNIESTFWKHLRIERKLNEIDIAVFKRVIDEVASDRPFIAINSTEPLMYKPILQAVEYCHQKALGVGITTGGYTLPQLAADLVEAGLTRLNVSVDGPKDIHNFIRGRPDSYERSIKGIELFIEASRKAGLKNKVYVNYTISSMNYTKLVEFSKLTNELPIELNYVQNWFVDEAMAERHNREFGHMYHASVACLSEHNDPKKIDIDVLYDQMQSLKGNRNIHFLPRLTKDELRTHYHQSELHMRKSSACMAAYFFMNVLADGSVIPFTRCPSMNLGNVNESSFYEIWNGPRMKEWRQFIKKEKRMPMCLKCDVIF